MKKSKLIIIVISVLLLNIFLINANLYPNKNNYNTAEIVRVTNTNNILCSLDPQPDNVRLYIVESKESWNNGDILEDVRGNYSEVPNSKFFFKEVWINPKPGSYDIIIDCIEYKKYNFLEPISSPSFTVVPKVGIGKTTQETIINNFSWQYDPEEPDLNKKILQIKISAEHEDIDLNNLTVELNYPENVITNLEIYVDKDNNGKLGSTDILIGNVETSNKTKVVPLNYVLKQEVDQNLLFVYKMNQGYTKGDYDLKVNSLYGTGIISNNPIRFFGLPLKSNLMTVLDGKTCLGALQLDLTPNPAPKDSAIVATASNLTGCDNKKVYLRTNACYLLLKKEVGFCVLKNGKCEITIDPVPGKYYACMDKNNDKDAIDFGESDSEDLTIKIEEVIVEISDTTEENTTTETEETAPITGRAIKEEGKVPLRESDAFLFLVEITLLLILFVLILIFFRLRGNFSEKGDLEEEEDEKPKEPSEDEFSEEAEKEESEEDKDKEETEEKKE